MSAKPSFVDLFTSLRRHALRLSKDTRGGIMVEYVVLVGAVAIAGSVGLIVVGIAVASSFDFVRGMLLVPIP